MEPLKLKLIVNESYSQVSESLVFLQLTVTMSKHLNINIDVNGNIT